MLMLDISVVIHPSLPLEIKKVETLPVGPDAEGEDKNEKGGRARFARLEDYLFGWRNYPCGGGESGAAPQGEGGGSPKREPSKRGRRKHQRFLPSLHFFFLATSMPSLKRTYLRGALLEP